MVFIYGAPAAGKLTIGREVARRTGFALFHNHLIMDALLAVFPFGSPEFVRLRESFWTETITSAARTGRPLVFTFCPEPTVGSAFAEGLTAIVEQEGGTVSTIRLDVSDEEQEKRLVAPSRTGGKLRRVEKLRLWKSAFEAAIAGMPQPDLSIDTTHVDAAEAAEQITHLVQLRGGVAATGG